MPGRAEQSHPAPADVLRLSHLQWRRLREKERNSRGGASGLPKPGGPSAYTEVVRVCELLSLDTGRVLPHWMLCPYVHFMCFHSVARTFHSVHTGTAIVLAHVQHSAAYELRRAEIPEGGRGSRPSCVLRPLGRHVVARCRNRVRAGAATDSSGKISAETAFRATEYGLSVVRVAWTYSFRTIVRRDCPYAMCSLSSSE